MELQGTSPSKSEDDQATRKNGKEASLKIRSFQKLPEESENLLWRATCPGVSRNSFPTYSNNNTAY